MNISINKTMKLLVILGINIGLLLGLELFSKFILTNFYVLQYTFAPKYANYETYQKIIGPFAPNQKVTLKYHLPYRVNINSMGLRGKDFSLNKTAGTYRILCLGDSMTFGFGVNGDAQVFPAVLEDELNHLNYNRNFEVINGGIGGTTIKDQYAFLVKKCLKVNPDLVILTFCRNDLNNLTREESVFAEVENGIAVKRGLVSYAEKTNTYKLLANTYRFLVCISKGGARRTLTKQKALLDSIKGLFSEESESLLVNNTKGIKLDQKEIEEKEQRRNLLWAEYAEYLYKMKDTLEKNNTKFMMAVILFDEPDEEENAYLSRVITESTDKLNIPMINYSAFSDFKSPEKELTFLPIDNHPSPYGHRLMAEFLRDFLLKNDLIH